MDQPEKPASSLASVAKQHAYKGCKAHRRKKARSLRSGLNPYQEETWRRQFQYYTGDRVDATLIVVKTPMVVMCRICASFVHGLKPPSYKEKMTEQDPASTYRRPPLK